MSIDTDVFNQAVADATSAVKPKLIALEVAIGELGLAADHPVITGVKDLHDELAAQLIIADALGETEGLHARSGGSDKGDGQ